MVDEISESEVREKLVERYHGDNSHRDLIRNVRRDGNGGVGSVVYSLEGTPPKGYAIYIPGKPRLFLIDAWGNSLDILNVRVTEPDVGWSGLRAFRHKVERDLSVNYTLRHADSVCDLCDLPETENSRVKIREVTVGGDKEAPYLCDGCYQKVRDMEKRQG